MSGGGSARRAVTVHDLLPLAAVDEGLRVWANDTIDGASEVKVVMKLVVGSRNRVFLLDDLVERMLRLRLRNVASGMLDFLPCYR